MDDTVVVSVDRKVRPSEVLLRRAMAVLAVLFLLQAIAFSTGFMLPCFLMTGCYFVYRYASRKEYEYTLTEKLLRIERVSDRGRRVLHEIPTEKILLVCPPDAPEALPYKKGGQIRVKKYDYTSYREGVPYYTAIAGDGDEKYKFLLDLTPEALKWLKRHCPGRVKMQTE